MKKAYKSLAFILFLFPLFIMTGCSEDDPSPSPSDPRENFTGSWRVTETETRQTYEVSILLDESSTTEVLIYNFGNAGSSSTPARAQVSGNNITLDADQVIGDGWTINGGGTLTGTNSMSWAYTIDDQATLHSILATYSRL